MFTYVSYVMSYVNIRATKKCNVMIYFKRFGLSFWRHPFTAEDQLVSKQSTFLQISSNEQTHSHLLYATVPLRIRYKCSELRIGQILYFNIQQTSLINVSRRVLNVQMQAILFFYNVTMFL